MTQRQKYFYSILTVTAIIAPGNVLLGQPVTYVDANASGAGNGSSWADAWTELADALDRAAPGDRIWVAAGRYQPGTLRNATFQLLDGVEVYGGFAGVEDSATFDLTKRDFASDDTILDGEIVGSSGTTNVFHVVNGSSVSVSAVLDGFTITGGRADGASVMMQDVGGGMLIVDGDPTIRNCTFRSNEAGTRGGAVHNYGGSPTFIGCRFFTNRTNVTQAANNLGGAFYSDGGPGLPANPTLINCLFVGNRAGVGAGGHGGGFYDDLYSSSTLINCTFAENRADTAGGGIFGGPRVTSCVLWANRDLRGTARSSQISGPANVEYSCVQGGWAGTGNTGDDPLFVDPAGDDGQIGTRDDDLRLSPGSPCIDAGDNETAIANVAFDLNGDPRLVDDPVTLDSGNPPAAEAIVDMGTFEYQAACDTAADCDDWIICNGAEVCVGGECQPGTAPTCDDGVSCTIDWCDMVTDECQHTPDDTGCDNGSFCDGVETCHPLFGCQDGTTPDCNDNVACTSDFCDAASDACENQPDDALCADGIDCTIDTCDDLTGACSNIPDDSACDDDAFCNGVETCDTALGCVAGVEPCASPLICDEGTDTCAGCAVDDDCDDGVECTVNTCNDLTGLCSNAPDDGLCDDGAYCNGAETCADSGCEPGSDPCPGQACDEEGDTCTSPPNSCSGDEDCDDQNPCTDDTCNAGDCSNVPNVTTCDDDDACTTNDVCSAGVCDGTPIPECPGSPQPTGDDPDADDDGVVDANDLCVGTPVNEAVDEAGCSCSQRDGDNDGVNDCDDECPDHANKAVPGVCGCDQPDTDSDEDDTPDCVDQCPDDAEKIAAGVCGCGVNDDDGDDDGTPDCNDLCSEDPQKTEPGECGCGVPDDDTDSDGVLDCNDACPDTQEGTPVGEDGCPEEPPAEQPVPDPDDGLDGTTASTDQDPDDPDPPAGSATGNPRCGACGAFGLISGALLWLGLLGLKTNSMRPRRSPRAKP